MLLLVVGVAVAEHTKVVQRMLELKVVVRRVVILETKMAETDSSIQVTAAAAVAVVQEKMGVMAVLRQTQTQDV